MDGHMGSWRGRLLAEGFFSQWTWTRNFDVVVSHTVGCKQIPQYASIIMCLYYNMPPLLCAFLYHCLFASHRPSYSPLHIDHIMIGVPSGLGLYIS